MQPVIFQPYLQHGMAIVDLSVQQAAVVEWARTGQGSTLVDAVAGSGKTSTLLAMLRALQGTVAFAAYNKKIAEEIKGRIDPSLTNVTAGTFHSFGLRAWTRHIGGRADVNSSKVALLAGGVHEHVRTFAIQLVSLAKQSGAGVLWPSEDIGIWREIVEHFDLDYTLNNNLSQSSPHSMEHAVSIGISAAMQLLQQSNVSAINHAGQKRSLIDFDDMIYAPLLFNVHMPQYDWVLIDEAQDTNPVRRALAKKMLKPGGRLVAVGDPHQAIYGFTGADSDAMSLIAKEFGAGTLPLSVSFRSARSIVEVAQQWVPHIEPAPHAADGRVIQMDMAEFDKLPAEALTRDDAILCRLTRPLVETAYALIKRGIGCHVEGRDIGTGLKMMVHRFSKHTELIQEMMTRMDIWASSEIDRLMAKGKETKAEAINDRVATLHVIAEQLDPSDPPAEMLKAIENLFGDTEPGQRSPNVTLSTVHRSKGREWDRVYLLGRNKYMPSKWARQDWQQVQERNLMYVAVTRAKHTLIEVNV